MGSEDSIFLLTEDGSLRALEKEGYVTEDRLQALLATHPQLLAGGQIDRADPRRWLLVAREVGIPSQEEGSNRWSIDHVFLDQDAVPTLVEVKRGTDTRIRREVVGQLLEYAANALTYWPPDFMRQCFEEACESRGVTSREVIQAFLLGESTEDEYWERAKTNLQAGKVRLLFVADEVPPELRQIVEFLNSQMNPAEVLAVEVKKYGGAGVSTLVPRVMGHTMAAERTKGVRRGQRKWDEESFFKELSERHGEVEVLVARRLLAWARERGLFTWWGEGSQSGSFVPIAVTDDERYQLFTVWTYGRVEICFQWYQSKTQFADVQARRELAERLSQIPGVDLGEEHLSKRPGLPLALFAPEESWREFISTFEWFLTKIDEVGEV